MSADIIWKQGDTLPAYADTLQYSDGTFPPLQGATVALRLRSLSNATLTTLTGTVTVVNPNAGQVQFVPTSTDTATPGNYLSEWVVTFALSTGLGTQTFPTDGYNWIFIEPTADKLNQQVVSLGAVKQYLNIQPGDHARDDSLIEIIEDVAPLVEATVGPLVPKLYEEWFDGGSNTISLTYDPSEGYGSHPYIQVVAASEYRGPIEYPLALVSSPVFGSIYSTMLVTHKASLTRRTAGGRTIAFMPGREAVHVWYMSGQQPIPGPVKRAAMEYVRTVYRWPQQTGGGTLSPADRMEAGAVLQAELSRIVSMWTRSMRRYPSIA